MCQCNQCKEEKAKRDAQATKAKPFLEAMRTPSK